MGAPVLPWLSLESLLTDPDGFALTTASPLQRAICRVLDGEALGALGNDPTVWAALGECVPPPGMPHEVVLLSGIRSGKSLIAACAAFRSAMVCDVTGLRPGEVPRVSVLSLTRKLADVTFSHLWGSVQASPELRKHVLREPVDRTLILRHPTGREIEVAVAAGSRAGGNLVGTWSAGVIFDEAPRMVGSDDGVVNLDDARNAVLERLLPGAQILYIGSPWAPMGPVYEWTMEHWGKPTRNMVVIRGRGPWMNPVQWTPERCELAKRNPTVYRTDVLGEFADADEAMFSSVAIADATRTTPEVVDPEPGLTYAAAIDPATRGNAWTFVVMGCRAPGQYFVALARQWKGTPTQPLQPDAVMGEIAEVCERYGIDLLLSDQWGGDFLAEMAGTRGLGLLPVAYTARRLLDMCERVRMLIDTGCLELPPDEYVSRDLIGTVKRLTATDAKIVLPRTKDGRHGDYVPPLAILCGENIEAPAQAQPRRARHLAEIERLTRPAEGSLAERIALRMQRRV